MELDAVSQIASGARNPTQELEASESRDELFSALDLLPERDRSIITLFATRIEERVRCKARPSPSTSRWSQRRGVSSLICHRNWLSP